MLFVLWGHRCPHSYCFCILIENLFNRLLLALSNTSGTFVSSVHTGFVTCPRGIFSVVGETEINKHLQHNMISGATVANTRKVFTKGSMQARFGLQQRIPRVYDYLAER